MGQDQVRQQRLTLMRGSDNGDNGNYDDNVDRCFVLLAGGGFV